MFHCTSFFPPFFNVELLVKSKGLTQAFYLLQFMYLLFLIKFELNGWV